MKFLIACLFALSTAAYGADLCSRYDNNTRYYKALTTVATYLGYKMEVLCQHPMFLDIEIQPNRVITRNGDIEPHVKVQLHKSYDSCYYLVRDVDQKVTEARCYNGY